MFPVDRPQKLRRTAELIGQQRRSCSTNDDDPNNHYVDGDIPVLHGVVVCLSGFSPEEKDRYHEIVLDLGGA
jgi:hypothetical protein